MMMCSKEESSRHCDPCLTADSTLSHILLCIKRREKADNFFCHSSVWLWGDCLSLCHWTVVWEILLAGLAAHVDYRLAVVLV